MTRPRAAELAGDAWALFRQDRELLLALAGPFWFLPSLALALLVPLPVLPAELEPGSREAALWIEQLAAWAGAKGWWYLVGAGVAAWGNAAVWALYLDRARPTLAQAIARGAALWPRLMLVQLLTGPAVALGLLLWFVPGLYVLARLVAAGPALVAERPLGAARAVTRSLALTRGAALPLMGPIAGAVALGWLGPQPFLALDGWLTARSDGANPVVLAMADAGVAAVAATAALASALIGVAAYRRLAR